MINSDFVSQKFNEIVNITYNKKIDDEIKERDKYINQLEKILSTNNVCFIKEEYKFYGQSYSYLSTPNLILRGESENEFIYKCEENFHSYFIGNTINKLRSINPNFSYLVGVEVPLNKEIGRSDKLNVFYEGGEPNLTLETYIRNCRPIDFLNKYLQILYSLNIANEKYDFTHYNLTTRNVYLKKIRDGVYSVPYKTENGYEYLKMSSTAIIYDFSVSHIKIDINGENKHFGVNNLTQYSIFPKRSYPLHDAYKLLLYCIIEIAKYKNKKCYIVVSRLLQYFTDETPIDVITNQEKYNYSLPFNLNLKSKSLLHFAKYIRDSFPVETESFLSKDSDVECVKSIVPFEYNKDVSDVYLFYDSYLLNSKNLYKINDISKFTERYDEKCKELQRRINLLIIYKLKGGKMKAIFNPDYQKIYRNYINKLTNIVDLYNDLSQMLEIGILISNEDKKLNNFFLESKERLNQDYKSLIDNAQNSLKSDMDYIENNFPLKNEYNYLKYNTFLLR